MVGRYAKPKRADGSAVHFAVRGLQASAVAMFGTAPRGRTVEETWMTAQKKYSELGALAERAASSVNDPGLKPLPSTRSSTSRIVIEEFLHHAGLFS